MGPEKTIFIEDDKARALLSSCGKKENSGYEKGVTNNQGMVIFKGRYKEGKTYVFEMENEGRKADSKQD